jgi:hypothetical protein
MTCSSGRPRSAMHQLVMHIGHIILALAGFLEFLHGAHVDHAEYVRRHGIVLVLINPAAFQDSVHYFSGRHRDDPNYIFVLLLEGMNNLFHGKELVACQPYIESRFPGLHQFQSRFAFDDLAVRVKHTQIFVLVGRNGLKFLCGRIHLSRFLGIWRGRRSDSAQGEYGDH